MGTTVTPDAGALVLTGFAPSLAVETSYLAYRLTIPGVGSVFAPGDPDPLPDTDFYITSKRGVHHPWIAQAGDGPNAGPDLSVGGQELQMPLGRTADGEVQIRVIDVAAPVATITCGQNILIDEGNASLEYPTIFHTTHPPSGGEGPWHREETFTTIGTAVDGTPTSAFNVDFGGSYLSFFILFGSDTYDGYMSRVFDGTEGGGAAWTPGQVVGFHARVNWALDTGPGNLFLEVNGVHVSFPNGAFDFWTVDPDLLPGSIFDNYISTTADINGEVEVRFGGENYGGSCNCVARMTDLQFVSCEPIISSVDSERYVTSWLADDDARQQLLGRKAYLEESLDGGTTWTRVLYSGYLRQAELGASLTYLLTLGDAGRGRRNSKAWSGLTPEVTP